MFGGSGLLIFLPAASFTAASIFAGIYQRLHIDLGAFLANSEIYLKSSAAVGTLAVATPTRFQVKKCQASPPTKFKPKLVFSIFRQSDFTLMLLKMQLERLFFFSIGLITEVFPSAEKDASALLSNSFDKSLFKQDGKSQFQQ